MATDVLRDFLVRLGFKVDDGSFTQFERKVEVATSQVVALSASVAAATASIALAVERWSKGFEDLYYASQRTNASAKNIKAFEYALSQVGGTAEGAHAAVENLARFMRNSPGAEGWLKSNGVATRDAAGKMLDTVEILKNFGRQLRSQPNYRANVLAEVIGLDEPTRQAMNRDFESFEREYAAKLEHFGLNAAAAAAKAQEVQQRLRSLSADIMIISDVALAKLAGIAEEVVDWFRQLSPELQTAIEWTVGLTTAWKALSLAFSLSPIGLIAALGVAIAGVWADYQAFVNTGKSELPWEKWTPVLRAVGDAADWAGQKLRGLHDWWQQATQPTLKAQLANGIQTLIAGDTQQGVRSSRINAAMAYFMGHGWTPAQASGIVAGMDAESQGNPIAVGDHGAAYGIFQWHGDRQAAFQKWSGKRMQDSTFQEQLAFHQFELTDGAERKAGLMLRAAQNADQAGRIESLFDLRPAAAAAEAAKRGAAAVALNNKVDIHVHGSGDPAATANAVAGAQDGVNQRAARDLQARVQ